MLTAEGRSLSRDCTLFAELTFSSTYQRYGFENQKFGLFANSVMQQQAARLVQRTVQLKRMGDPPASPYTDRRVGEDGRMLSRILPVDAGPGVAAVRYVDWRPAGDCRLRSLFQMCACGAAYFY